MDDLGKVPPQEIAMEEAVLGACMIENCFAEVYAILKPEHFYKSAHEHIFQSMVRLFKASNPIDSITVTEDCKSHGTLETIGGAYFIIQLTNKVGSSGNVEYHSTVVKEKWVARALIHECTQGITKGYSDTTDVFELLDNTKQGLETISTEVQASEEKDFYETLTKQVYDINVSQSKPEEKKQLLGLPTGLHSLDRKILGYSAPDLIVIAGRNGEGKTSLAIQSAHAILEVGEPVGFVSAEMKLPQLNLKMLSLKTDIDVSRLRTGDMSKEELNRVNLAFGSMDKYRFKVHDKPITPEETMALAKYWVKKFGIKALFFDYIQRSKMPKNMVSANRNDQIQVVTNNLKDIALELEIPVIALSQMNREIERRSGDSKRPQLSDLRDGGSVEADSDIVLFVFRPEIHGIKNFEDGSSTENKTEIIIAKNRLSKKGAIVADFVGSGNRFDDTGSTTFQTSKGPVIDFGKRLTPLSEATKEEDSNFDLF